MDSSEHMQGIASTGSVILSAEGLCKLYGGNPSQALAMLRAGADRADIRRETGASVAVAGVSFDLPAGKILALLGRSNSGKSTLIRMLNRLVEPTGGTVFLNGRDMGAMTPADLVAVRRDTMAMTFGTAALMPNRSLLDNVAFGLEVAGLRRRDRRDRALAVLTRIGLGHVAAQLPHEVPFEVRLRIGLARTLMGDPSILLMDVPFAGVDPVLRQELEAEFLEWQRAHRATVLLTTQEPEEAVRLADLIAFMETGRITQIGTPDEILESPANEHVRAAFQDIAASRRQRLRAAHLEELISHFERTAMEGLDTVDSSAGALDGTARQLTGIIDRTNEQASSTVVAAEQIASNVQSVSALADDTFRSLDEIRLRIDDSARIALSAVEQARKADQSVHSLRESAQDIGNVRRRGRQRLCGGGAGGPSAGQPDREGDAGRFVPYPDDAGRNRQRRPSPAEHHGGDRGDQHHLARHRPVDGGAGRRLGHHSFQHRPGGIRGWRRRPQRPECHQRRPRHRKRHTARPERGGGSGRPDRIAAPQHRAAAGRHPCRMT
ncbi:glycine/betaine ABC transporter ATP-binding protein (plasmid) [Azospirillum humicireducens]|uniref:Glycine/betaine ABC transporter ATP-binding protein n=1 Tax=Azospirillum humicireducens TaxID=1226968 RepID=A0A2R4VRH8_9PROT|nr:glycine/betaine ABC transporter ATP-binding protein [Azospirillum humicireducens]